MSLEAFGDEGEVAQNWEDTEARKELFKLEKHFKQWRKEYEDDFMKEDLDNIEKYIESLLEKLQGKL